MLSTYCHNNYHTQSTIRSKAALYLLQVLFVISSHIILYVQELLIPLMTTCIIGHLKTLQADI